MCFNHANNLSREKKFKAKITLAVITARAILYNHIPLKAHGRGITVPYIQRTTPHVPLTHTHTASATVPSPSLSHTHSTPGVPPSLSPSSLSTMAVGTTEVTRRAEEGSYRRSGGSMAGGGRWWWDPPDLVVFFVVGDGIH